MRSPMVVLYVAGEIMSDSGSRSSMNTIRVGCRGDSDEVRPFSHLPGAATSIKVAIRPVMARLGPSHMVSRNIVPFTFLGLGRACRSTTFRDRQRK